MYFNFSITFSADTDICDRTNISPLHVAAEKGHLSCLQLLLNADACCNIATTSSKHVQISITSKFIISAQPGFKDNPPL